MLKEIKLGIFYYFMGLDAVIFSKTVAEHFQKTEEMLSNLLS